jgi:DNA-binding transcriptional ArsR family regulator
VRGHEWPWVTKMVDEPYVNVTCNDADVATIGPLVHGFGIPCLRRYEARGLILNHMVQYATARLDASFAALADGTRRGVLEQLGRTEASITDLAEQFHMTLTGMRKHVGVLEDAGLVVTKKVGRVRYCRVGARRLDEVTAWIDRYHQLWDERFSELDKVVEELKLKEQRNGRTQQE